MAKPTLYTDALWADILAWLAEGHCLTDWCRAVDGRPKPRTVREWGEKDPDKLAQLDAAFDAGQDARIERARKTLRGYGPDKGGESTGDVMRDKAIAYYDFQIAERLTARYSNRTRTELTGKNGEPLVSGIQVTFVRPDPG